MTESHRGSDRRLIRWIMIGLIAWGIVLAVGVFFVWNDRLRWWRVAIVLGAVGLFVGSWYAALQRSDLQ